MVAERERIAREMHDGLAQVLGYVNTKSQAIEELLLAGRTDEARGLLAELAAAARSIYVDVREAILGLRSPVVPGVGLIAAVEDYADRFAEASKIVVRVEASADARHLDLGPEVQAQLFRIVQEALTNVRKHSGARRADIAFEVQEGRLEVAIADTGRGFESAPGGWGSTPVRSTRHARASGQHRRDDRMDEPAGRWLPSCAQGGHGEASAGHGRDRLMRIVLADDHALFRDGVSSLLRAWGHEVVGLAADGREAVDLVDRLKPDLVLMDVRMPVMSGVEASGEIAAGGPRRRS